MARALVGPVNNVTGAGSVGGALEVTMPEQLEYCHVLAQ